MPILSMVTWLEAMSDVVICETLRFPLLNTFTGPALNPVAMDPESVALLSVALFSVALFSVALFSVAPLMSAFVDNVLITLAAPVLPCNALVIVLSVVNVPVAPLIKLSNALTTNAVVAGEASLEFTSGVVRLRLVLVTAPSSILPRITAFGPSLAAVTVPSVMNATPVSPLAPVGPVGPIRPLVP